jgi:hypothetical protein
LVSTIIVRDILFKALSRMILLPTALPLEKSGAMCSILIAIWVGKKRVLAGMQTRPISHKSFSNILCVVESIRRG